MHTRKKIREFIRNFLVEYVDVDFYDFSAFLCFSDRLVKSIFSQIVLRLFQEHFPTKKMEVTGLIHIPLVWLVYCRIFFDCDFQDWVTWGGGGYETPPYPLSVPTVLLHHHGGGGPSGEKWGHCRV